MGKEFLELFEQWADTYDATVDGHDPEYKDVFLHYEKILNEVAERSWGRVLEFGPGTGNLTKKLVARGLQVTAVEPSPSMRNLARKKLGSRAAILDGDFFNYPEDQTFDTMVSTYAFHHLTDAEKEQAVSGYGNHVASGGKIVFADTMYDSIEAYEKAVEDALSKGYKNLAEDLQREYYTTIPVLKEMLEKNGFSSSFERCNDFVWIMTGVKK
ncbi:class I SAM-dependent methyltransferase [Bacillus sp. T33-2]|uniref:class I SAM-dependent methyltransferase n=1 Tax=Bacillus sp. T33-2 TaxID=2054168 RepID=UPI000C775DC6|nr:class I SAM-dependent methyltransferase [Bacillus sp. T33-2]PLR93775.1 SAM-dependent methyltransferase [Bacillus sp. T33-2]